MVNISDVNDIVTKVRNSDHIIIPRRRFNDKNEQTRNLLGITYNDQVDLVRSIDAKNYYQGPLGDRDSQRGGVLWIFKKEAYGEMFYIKFKYKADDNSVIAISCHLNGMCEE